MPLFSSFIQGIFVTIISMKKYLGIYLAALIFIIQLILLPRVGMSWDEPSSFFVGRANLKFWMTGNRAYLNDLRNKQLFADSPFPYIYGEDIYPPFQFLVSSATSYVFAEHLHLMDVPTAHHAGNSLPPLSVLRRCTDWRLRSG